MTATAHLSPLNHAQSFWQGDPRGCSGDLPAKRRGQNGPRSFSFFSSNSVTSFPCASCLAKRGHLPTGGLCLSKIARLQVAGLGRNAEGEPGGLRQPGADDWVESAGSRIETLRKADPRGWALYWHTEPG
jgi:hypothetical protein